MLNKLFKYDFQALSKRLWPVQIAVIGGSLLAGACLAYDISQMQAISSTTTGQMFDVIINIVMVLMLIAIAASAVITLLMTCSYFNRSLLCDEGYLSFTLPVRTSQLLWSKIWVGFVWCIINLFAVILGMVIFCGIGFIPVYGDANFVEVFQKIAEGLREFEAMAPGFSFDLFFTVCVLSSLICEIASLIMIYFSITAAHAMTKRHRILVTIALLIGISTVLSILFGIVTFSLTLNMTTALIQDQPMSVNMLYLLIGVETLITAGVGAGLYFWMQHLLGKKLNLE